MSRPVIRPVKYADDVPHSMIDRLNEIGKYYEMEIDVKRN